MKYQGNDRIEFPDIMQPSKFDENLHGDYYKTGE